MIELTEQRPEQAEPIADGVEWRCQFCRRRPRPLLAVIHSAPPGTLLRVPGRQWAQWNVYPHEGMRDT